MDRHTTAKRSLALGFAIVHCVIPLAFVLQGPEAIAVHLTIDDSYYYFLTAWNARESGLISFDGINRTNGFHFLWFLILRALASACTDKFTFLQAAMAVDVALTAVPHFVICRIAWLWQTDGRAMLRQWTLSAAWLLVCMWRPNQYLSGLEAPLHAAVLWTALCQYLLYIRELDDGRPRRVRLVGLVVLLVLNSWARLDSAILSLAIIVPTVWMARRSLRGRALLAHVAPAALIVAVGALVQVWFFRVAGDSMIPVSGMLKRHAADYGGIGPWVSSSLVLLPIRLDELLHLPRTGYVQSLNLLVVAAVFVLLASSRRVRRAVFPPETRTAQRVLGTLAAGLCLHAAALFGVFSAYEKWYLSGTFIFGTLLAGHIVTRIHATGRIARSIWLTGGAVSVAAALAIGWWSLRIADPMHQSRIVSARYLNEQTSDGVVVAAFNAGVLGFFCDRPVVNLDGLINHVTYFRQVIASRSRAAMLEYLDRLNVAYVVDNEFRGWLPPSQAEGWLPAILTRYKVVRTFEISGATPDILVMKRIRPASPLERRGE